MNSMKKLFLLLVILIFIVSGIFAQQGDNLDKVIENAAKGLEATMAAGTKLAILNFSSPSEIFSDYVIEELTGIFVTGRKVTMIERTELALIRKEMDLQLSGDVDDKEAQAIGRQLGAQYIVSGNLTDLGNRYRFRIRAINVGTAVIQEQISLYLLKDQQVAFLLTGKLEEPAAAPSAPAAPATSAAAPPAAAPAPAQSTSSQGQSRPGLYVNDTFQGQMDLMDAIDWIALNVKSGGNYVIVLGKDEAAPYISLSYNNLQVNVTLKGSGAERRVRYEVQNPSYPLFTVSTGVTFTLEDGVSLVGLQNNSKPLINIDGGTFIMNGGSISGNTISYSREYSGGGGVLLNSGAFIMNSGIISGNTANIGGAVYINQGTFTMRNGTITGNTATSQGGGVYINQGSFSMNGGVISANTAYQGGGGVLISSNGTFTKSGSGGIIYGTNASETDANKIRNNTGAAVADFGYTRVRNTTARISTALDSRQRGAAGGWE